MLWALLENCLPEPGRRGGLSPSGCRQGRRFGLWSAPHVRLPIEDAPLFLGPGAALRGGAHGLRGLLQLRGAPAPPSSSPPRRSSTPPRSSPTREATRPRTPISTRTRPPTWRTCGGGCASPRSARRTTASRRWPTLVRDDLRALGFKEAELVPTDGHPGVWGYYDAGAEKTLVVYMMYDVQPVEPEGWPVSAFDGRAGRPPAGQGADGARRHQPEGAGARLPQRARGDHRARAASCR